MKIGIIGCGNMGEGLARRLSEKYPILLYDRHEQKREKLASEIKGKASDSAAQLASEADVIILAIKPHHFSEVAVQIYQSLKPEQLVISVMTGISLNTMKGYFTVSHLLRMMPNLAVRYGKGVVGLAENPQLSAAMKKTIEDLCAPLGKYLWLGEEQLNGLTALTGSGPAFVLVMIEAMIDASIAMGFSAEQGRMLTLQMLKGAISMLEESGKHPGELRWEVTSPSGTTIAGIKSLEDEGLRAGIINTFLSTYQRAHAISDETI